LSNELDLVKVEKVLADSWKTVDAIVNNAGSFLSKPFAETTQEDYESVYKVNVLLLTNSYLSALPAKGSHVVTISSMGGIQGSLKFAGLAAYSSSKGAVITLSELLAEEYKERGISFVLALGAVQTEMLERLFLVIRHQ
jgi:NAD(P)-dependent dehydrogenase (short-subunit alcohol dehydrogenase family)